MEPPNSNPDNERLFKETSNPGFFSDFWDFLRTSRKWWMLPLLVLFLLTRYDPSAGSDGSRPLHLHAVLISQKLKRESGVMNR